MKYFNNEVKIALVAVIGVVLLFFGMQFLKGLNLFSSDNTYYISFTDISGLSASSPIYSDGYKVGTVKSINYDYNHKGDIDVEVAINKDMRIPKGSSAEIVSDMLGNVKINLLLANNPRERVLPGERIEGNINAGALGQVKDMIPALVQMLPKLDSIMTSINNLLADPSIRQSLHHVENITAGLTTSTAQLNTLLASLNRGVPGMMAKANGVLDNTKRLTGNLADLDVAGTLAKVDATLASAKQFTDQLNSNKGSLGLLMNDASLYHNLNATMMHADSLVVNLKQHPKRYVHFSIFGRKDK